MIKIKQEVASACQSMPTHSEILASYLENAAGYNEKSTASMSLYGRK